VRTRTAPQANEMIPVQVERLSSTFMIPRTGLQALRPPAPAVFLLPHVWHSLDVQSRSGAEAASFSSARSAKSCFGVSTFPIPQDSSKTRSTGADATTACPFEEGLSSTVAFLLGTCGSEFSAAHHGEHLQIHTQAQFALLKVCSALCLLGKKPSPLGQERYGAGSRAQTFSVVVSKSRLPRP
jgi:hypothetical protein